MQYIPLDSVLICHPGKKEFLAIGGKFGYTGEKKKKEADYEPD